MGFKELCSRYLNTVHLGLSFFVLFSADFTITSLQKLLSESISEDDADYQVDGYVSMGLIYLVFGIGLLSAPTVLSFTGPRITMIIGSVMMTAFFLLFAFENTYLTYLGVLLTGTGGSLLWVGQGNYVILHSGMQHVSTHVSLFWAIFIISMMSGSVYSAVVFAAKTRIDYDTRSQLFMVVTTVGVVSVVMFSLMRPPKAHWQLTPVKDSPLIALKRTFSLYWTREFLILLPTFTFIGFQQSFGWGIYCSAIGFTESFGVLATQLAPINAIAYGAGDSIGAAVHIFAPNFGYNWTRRYVFWSGYILHVVAMVAVALNLPNNSVFGYTKDAPIIGTPQVWLTIICSIGLGISDGFYNTQVFPLLASMHPEYSAQTSALFKFTKSMTVALFFFASLVLGLRLQLLLITIVGLVGSICFSIVDAEEYKRTSEIKGVM